MSKPNTTSAHLSHSLFLKALFYLNTVFLSQKSTSAKSAFLGAKQSHTVTLSERQILLNTDWTKDVVCVVFFLPQKLLKLLEKKTQYDVYPCLQMFNQCPFRGSCAYKQHRSNYIHCCKEQMCKLVVSWGKIIPSPLSRNVHSAVQL